MSEHGVVSRAWQAMAEDRRLRVEALEAELLEVQAERDEARGVARDMATLLRAGTVASAAYVERQARHYPWLERGEGLE